MGGCGVPTTLTDFTQGQHPPWGGDKRGVGEGNGRGGVRGTKYCTTGTQIPGGRYVPGMRVSLSPGRSTEAPPGEQRRC